MNYDLPKLVADYKKLRSLAKTAKKHGMSTTGLWRIFKDNNVERQKPGGFSGASSLHGKRTYKPCKQCGKPFRWFPSGDRKFCSKKCMHDFMRSDRCKYKHWTEREERKCSQCGEIFETRKSSKKRYCTHECASEAKTGISLKKKIKPIKIVAAISAYFKSNRSILRAGRLLGVSATPIERLFREYGIYEKATKKNRAIKRCKRCGTRITPYGDVQVCNACQGKMMREENHWNWTGGPDNPLRAIRGRVAMSEWRKAVFKRDDYTCQACGRRGVKLNAHHVLPLRDREDLAYIVSNGITLCERDHQPTKGNEYAYAQLFSCIIARRA